MVGGWREVVTGEDFGRVAFWEFGVVGIIVLGVGLGATILLREPVSVSVSLTSPSVAFSGTETGVAGGPLAPLLFFLLFGCLLRGLLGGPIS